MVPDGVEEVELAKIDLEQKEREQKLLHDDIRKLSLYCDTSGDHYPEREGDLWMITGGKSILVRDEPCEQPLPWKFYFLKLIFNNSSLLTYLYISSPTLSHPKVC